jgi:DNA-binding transcriptional MerR regulator
MTITEVSERYDIPQNTLRYYERIGLLPRVKRNKSGIRDYTEEDCGWVEFIKCLRNAGIPIEVLLEYVELFLQGDEDTVEARKELLIEHRVEVVKRIENLKKSLERIDYKIAVFEKRIVAAEKTLKKPEN